MSDLLDQVADYYDDKLRTHGQTAKGVDWNSEDSQNLRFGQLCKVLPKDGPVSINDLGCGYGAFYEYLKTQRTDAITYNGYDVSTEMITAAKQRLGNSNNLHLACTAEPDRVADFTIASGIFNVRMERSDAEWLPYIEGVLDVMDRASTHGFAFNCLTSYSDANKMRDYLYYASPTALFDLCKRRYARNVALLHDYELYEFTIIVRKAT